MSQDTRKTFAIHNSDTLLCYRGDVSQEAHYQHTAHCSYCHVIKSERVVAMASALRIHLHNFDIEQ